MGLTAAPSTSSTPPMTSRDMSPPSPTMARLSTPRLSPLPTPSLSPAPLSMLLPALSSMLLSTPPLSTVELARCPTSLCPSHSRVSTGPPPSPRPSELTSPPSTTLPAPSTELTAGTDLLLLDMELSLVKKPKSRKPNDHDDHPKQKKTRLTFQQQN